MLTTGRGVGKNETSSIAGENIDQAQTSCEAIALVTINMYPIRPRNIAPLCPKEILIRSELFITALAKTSSFPQPM